MDRPEILYAKHPEFPDEVAWSVSFVPTFEKIKSIQMKLKENEIPESTLLEN